MYNMFGTDKLPEGLKVPPKGLNLGELHMRFYAVNLTLTHRFVPSTAMISMADRPIKPYINIWQAVPSLSVFWSALSLVKHCQSPVMYRAEFAALMTMEC